MCKLWTSTNIGFLHHLVRLKSCFLWLKKTQQGLFTTDDNIDACRLETLYILKQDKALEKNNKALLNRLQATLGKKPTTPAEKNRLAYHLKYAIGILQPVYMEWVLTELEASVVCGNVGDIEYFANIASSQAIHNGWSPSALYDMLRFFRDIYLKLLLTSQRGIWILLKKLFATYEITMMYS